MTTFRSRFTKSLSALSAGVLVLGLAACSGTENETESETQNAASGETAVEQTGEWPRTVQTDDGELTLEEQPERIVSTSTTLTGSLLAIGAPVVATAYTGANNPGLTDEHGFFSQWTEPAEEAGVEKLWSNAEPEIEKAATFAPDLIIVSKNSGDSQYEHIDKLKEIAPVMVLDYSGADWQDITTTLGEATGYEEGAKEAIASYDERLAEVKENINVPADKTASPFIIFGGGNGVAALTPEAPQTRILKEVGFDLTEVPENIEGDKSMGADRSDMLNLSWEVVPEALHGDMWIVVAANEGNRETFKNTSILNDSPQNKAGEVYFLPGETFRLDYYSAMMMLDSIEEQFA